MYHNRDFCMTFCIWKKLYFRSGELLYFYLSLWGSYCSGSENVKQQILIILLRAYGL